MSAPKKPKKNVDDFLFSAKADKKPPATKLVSFHVRLPDNIIETIRKNCGGNQRFFTEQVFRDYFDRNNISLEDET